MTWRNTTALVTGACGFIGSHLTEALVSRGANVKALAFYNAQGSRGWLDSLPSDIKNSIEMHSGDIRDTELMRRLIGNDDTVFHLAALIGIPYSYHAPRSYLETNAGGTLNILEAAKQKQARRLLVISTSEVYGSAHCIPIPETHVLQAQSPYAASKIAAEKLAESYYRSFNLPVTVVRPFNTYGPRQSPRAVIPTILMQALTNDHSLQLGDLTTTRDFNYVDDTVEGLVRLAACEAALGATVNIGTGCETTVSDVVGAAERIAGRALHVTSTLDRMRPRDSEVLRLCADNTRLRELVAWVPSTPIETGLQRTAEWMQPRLKQFRVGDYYT